MEIPMKNPFHFPRTNRGQRQVEFGLIAAGIAVAILAVWLQLAAHKPQPRLDKLGLFIELTR